jgi:hypothetical protein
MQHQLPTCGLLRRCLLAATCAALSDRGAAAGATTKLPGFYVQSA